MVRFQVVASKIMIFNSSSVARDNRECDNKLHNLAPKMLQHFWRLRMQFVRREFSYLIFDTI